MKKIVYFAAILITITVVSCTTLVIRDGVTEIPDHKYEHKGLTSITIPDSVVYIGSYAFSKNKLTSVTIPGSVTKIGVSAFAHNNLTSITMLNGLTEIGDYTFYENKLSSLILPDSVTKIGRNAFAHNNLTSIVIPESITEIGFDAFANNKITNLIIPDNVTKIDNDAFAKNPLKSVTLTLNEKISIAGNAFGTIINFNRFFLANNKQSGTYSWQDNNYYYNGEIIPYSAVVAYEQGELQRARELTELARAQERERIERIRRENAFMQVIWAKNVYTNDLLSGTVISRIDSRPASEYFYAEGGNSTQRTAGLMIDWYILSPGLHTFELRYRDENHGYREIITTTASGTIILLFEAGKAYLLNEEESGNRIRYSLSETRGP
jgi:hypothetical protein